MKLKVLIAVVSLASGFFSVAGFASDVKDNWDITSYENGIPKAAIYSDNNMRIKLIVQQTLPREGGGWRVVFLRAEIYSNKDLLERTSRSKAGSFDILGYRTSLWSEDVQKIGSKKLAVKNIPIPALWCGNEPKFIQYATSMGAIHISFPIQEMESGEFQKLIDRWRGVLPDGRTCEQEYEDYLDRLEKKEAKQQAQDDYVDELIDDANSQGDVMLVTNQKLLECKFEPQCEAQLLEEVDICKKTTTGKYTESCIRAIEAPK